MLALRMKSNGLCKPRGKSCVWTWPATWPLLARMDDTSELLALLYTRIGMLMEDTSVIALELAANDVPNQGMHSDRMLRAIDEIRRLADAADILVK